MRHFGVVSAGLVCVALGHGDHKDTQSESQSGSYQHYYQQYMKKYTGGNSGGNWQQYMKKYGGGSQSSSGTGDYSQYMKQYAGGSQGYQKYMKKYAQGSQGSSGAGDYSQYMKQYAGGSQGYQQYMQKYTGRSQGSGSATELLQMPTDSVELEEQPQHDDDSQKKYVQDERKQQESYMKEFVPKDVLKKAMRKEGVKGGHEWDSDGEDAHHEMSADDRLMKSVKDAKEKAEPAKPMTFLAQAVDTGAMVFSPASLAAAALTGTSCLVIGLMLKKRTASVGVSFPESTLG